MELNLTFVAGLPRSGSTLLLNLLGQNPACHVTPTSGLINLFTAVKGRWTEVLEFKSEGLERVRPRVASAMRGLLHGYFEPEFADGKHVFDKSRGWLQQIEPLEECLGRPVRIVVTVRDVRAIIASFEKIYRSRRIDYREAGGDDFFKCQTVEGRARAILGSTAVVGLTIARLRDALERGVGDRLVLVPYHELTRRPREAMHSVGRTLGLPEFAYPDNVRQVTHEDDTFHGMDLHRIRPRIEPPRAIPWEGVLPPPLCVQLARIRRHQRDGRDGASPPRAAEQWGRALGATRRRAQWPRFGVIELSGVICGLWLGMLNLRRMGGARLFGLGGAHMRLFVVEFVE